MLVGQDVADGHSAFLLCADLGDVLTVAFRGMFAKRVREEHALNPLCTSLVRLGAGSEVRSSPRNCATAWVVRDEQKTPTKGSMFTLGVLLVIT